MPTDDMFERASRLAIRFDTHQGSLAVEDLWVLPLKAPRQNQVSLNDIAKDLNRQIQKDSEESFVDPITDTDSKTQLKFDLVKYIISVLLTEREATITAASRRAERQRLAEIIGKKKDQQLEETSIEELEHRLASLEA